MKHYSKVLCNGLVVAKRRDSCNGNSDITQEWKARCGNVAFMNCGSTNEEICVAGFSHLRLVYDQVLG